MKSNINRETILTENPDRHTMLPIHYPEVWKMYKQAVASFWTTEEVDLSNDKKDFDNLTDGERHFIKYVLAFFAASDGIVLENLGVRFMKDVQISEVRAFYAFQIAMETIHSEMYSLLLEEYIKDSSELNNMLHAIRTIPCVKKKADWAFKWIESSDSFAVRLVAFACVEGIFFSGSFCAIYWLKKRNFMHGLTFSNELISRDEGLHTAFACLIYRELLVDKLSQVEAQQIIKQAVDIELEFVCDALSVDLIGMKATSMSQYIRFVADRLLIDLGYEKFYKVTNPFDFMELISLQGKTNFFEKRVSDYKKAGVMQPEQRKEKTSGLLLDPDF